MGALRSLVAGSVRFRLLVVALAAGLVVLGATQLAKMHADVLPETAPPVVEVQTEALGLSAPEVESLVTVPMEHNLLDGVMGVSDVTSDSLPGLSSIDLHFQRGFDVLRARQLVQERLTQAFALPNVSKPPVMLQPVSSTSRVMMVGLTSRRLSPIELSVLARWTIVPRLLGLAGVANVSSFGQADRQLQVLVDPAHLAARHVTLAQVIATAGNSQLVSPLSYLEASTPGTGGFLEGPNQRITIRHLLPFGTPRDLARVPVADVPGAPLPLGSVARVVQDHQPLIGDAVVGGGSGLVLVVQKLPSASVPAVTHEVEQALADLRPGLAGVHIDSSLFRPATYVKSSFDNLATLALVAAALAALALVALLLDLRLAFIGLAAVVLALLAAALVLDTLGYAFNALVALGLLIALAVVVTDAVAAVRELAAARSHGRSPSAALVDAYQALGPSLGYGLLVVLLAAAPALVATGPTARFVHPLMLAFALAALASFAAALTLLPALAVVLLPDARPHGAGRALTRRLAAGYRAALERALRIPRAPLLALCALGIAAIAVVPSLGQPRPPAFQDRSLVVHWTAPPGTSLREMDRITARASDELKALPGVQDVGATIGRAVTSDQVVNTSSAEIWVTIRPHVDYGRALASVRAVAAGTPGVSGAVGTYEADSMPGVLAPPDRRLVVRVYGDDYAALARLAARVRDAMAGVGGVAASIPPPQQEQPAIEVTVDVARAEQHGVKPGDVRREAATLLSGLTVGNFFEQQKVFDVVVWGTPSARTSVESVANLLLDGVGGAHVRLGDVARVAVRPDPPDIQHEAMSRYVDVTAAVHGRSAASARADVTRALRSLAFPLGAHAEVLAGPSDGGTSHAAFVSYEIAAIVGIFLVIQAALGSWPLALVVFTLLPASLVGGLLVALASGDANTLGAVAGLVAVLAVTARQAIGFGVRLRSGGTGPTREAVLTSAERQAGPTVAAAAMVVVALAPFALAGDVAGNEMLHVAAAVVVVGVIGATLLNLFVLPAACVTLGNRPRRAAAAPAQTASAEQ